MKVDVFMTPGEVTPADVQGRVVAVIDVLRASTSIATALNNGARTVVPVEDANEAITRARNGMVVVTPSMTNDSRATCILRSASGLSRPWQMSFAISES